MIWFYSDPHFGHTKIIEHCNRPFKTVEQMNEALIENYRARVQPKDLVYILGDFAFTDPEKFLRKLPGQKHLILGNHDQKWRSKWEGWGLAWVKDTYELKTSDPKRQIWLSHYSHQTWPGKHRGTWHVFGHSHGKLPPVGNSVDVGVDCWEFAPVSIEQLDNHFKKLTSIEPTSDGRSSASEI